MENIATVAGLKNAIQLLEIEQTFKGQQLKDQFLLTVENLKPVNLIRNALKDITSSPGSLENILASATGLATGFLSGKLVVGASGSIVRKLLIPVLQFGITNFVVRHPDIIKSLGQYIFQHIFHKRGIQSEKP